MRLEFRSAISVAALGAIAILVLVPTSAWAAMPPVCLFRNALGIECLGCGMTRALASAAHGHFAEAVAHNAGVVIAAPVLLAAALQRLWPGK